MKYILSFLVVATLFSACNNESETSSTNPVNWERRTVTTPLADSVESGGTYLSIYSQIYSMTEQRTHDLTVTVSMRNTSLNDTVYVNKAEYYDTKGDMIRSYFENPIYLLPMETVHIVIDGTDREGGTGANFVFDWSIKPSTNVPLFEAVMISTLGQQGLSFSTTGERIY